MYLERISYFRNVKNFNKKNKNPSKNSVKGLYVYNKNDIIKEKNNIGRKINGSKRKKNGRRTKKT